MNQIIYTNLGGQPLTQNALDFLQNSFTDAFKGIGRFIGDKTIIDGVSVVGGFASNGYVVIDGEILPFIGGAVGAEVVVVETIAQKLYNDGITKDTLKTRYVTFGSPGIAFNTFSKLSTIKNMFYSLCPIGAVVPYEGLLADLPPNWELHTLSKGRVIVGQDDADADFAALGQTGGEKKHTQTTAEMPAHSHHMNGNSNGGSGGFGGVMTSNYTGFESISDSNGGLKTIEDTGGGQAFNILQPYYVMAMIKRVS